MKQLKNKILCAGMILLYVSSIALFAADDPSIKQPLRGKIQKSMEKYIKENSIDGRFPLYDAVKGKLLWLKLDKLHEGIVKKTDFYVSCADFHDVAGTYYDIDFLVTKNGLKIKTVEAVVHKEGKNSEKRKYHLEN